MNSKELSNQDEAPAGNGGTARRTLDYYLSLPYTIELWRAEEGGWISRVLELQGCVSQGETDVEALEMIHDAMQGWLAMALEMGDPIPEPRREEDYSGKFVVRVPRSLHRQLVERAEQEDVSLNQYCNVALAEAVGAAQAAKPALVPGTQAPTPVDALWPGLQGGLRQTLTVAGYGPEAGALDERLFGEWFERAMAQVEAALARRFSSDALAYLDSMIPALRSGANRSQALAVMYRMTVLLRQQIESIHQLRSGVVDQIQGRVSGYAQQTNTLFVQQQFVQEESASYAFERAALRRPEQSEW